MSLEAYTWAWKQTGLSALEKLVLMSLADQVADGEYGCWPQVSFIRYRVGASERTVQRALSALAQHRLVAVFPLGDKRNGNRRTTNYYLLAHGGDLEPTRIDLTRSPAQHFVVLQGDIYPLLTRPDDSAKDSVISTTQSGYRVSPSQPSPVKLTGQSDKPKQEQCSPVTNDGASPVISGTTDDGAFIGIIDETNPTQAMPISADRGKDDGRAWHGDDEEDLPQVPPVLPVARPDIELVRACLPLDWKPTRLQGTGLTRVTHELQRVLTLGHTPTGIAEALAIDPLPPSVSNLAGLVIRRLQGFTPPPAIPPQRARATLPEPVEARKTTPARPWVIARQKALEEQKALGDEAQKEQVPHQFQLEFGSWLAIHAPDALQAWLDHGINEDMRAQWIATHPPKKRRKSGRNRTMTQ